MIGRGHYESIPWQACNISKSSVINSLSQPLKTLVPLQVPPEPRTTFELAGSVRLILRSSRMQNAILSNTKTAAYHEVITGLPGRASTEPLHWDESDGILLIILLLGA